MHASEVRSILQAEIGPVMTELGFKRLGAPANWCRREDAGKYLQICTYLSRNGFDPEYGNWFRIEFNYASGLTRRSEVGETVSAGAFLDPESIAAIILVRNEAMTVIPRFTPDGLFGAYHFYGPEHVTAYAKILAAAMPAMLNRVPPIPSEMAKLKLLPHLR